MAHHIRNTLAITAAAAAAATAALLLGGTTTVLATDGVHATVHVKTEYDAVKEMHDGIAELIKIEKEL
ncbi:hypothetical protein [Amycolatopsis sp. cmx-11-12]|uniref:hypothetical protein n=1 Tax=Amycolatopsis sp. cmx-11-12 TaxID=2785795 RepID=UPI003917DB16